MIYGPEVLLGVEFEWESICLKAVLEGGGSEMALG
jgi:hypothetical protein